MMRDVAPDAPCRDHQCSQNSMLPLQISAEDVKALDAQWEEVAMRSDVPITADDIQEVCTLAAALFLRHRHAYTVHA